MKKSVFAVVPVLAFAAMSTIAVSCGSSEDNNDNKESKAVETPDTAKIEHVGFETSINIRYVDMARIMENYTYAVQEMEKLQKKALEFEQYRNSQATKIQKMENDIAQKQQNNGYFSQESFDKDVQNYQATAQSAQTQLNKRAQALDSEAAQVNQTIMKAIDNYIMKYNETRHYDAILHKDAAAYFNPALDITDEIIEGLNAQAAPVQDDKNSDGK